MERPWSSCSQATEPEEGEEEERERDKEKEEEEDNIAERLDKLDMEPQTEFEVLRHKHMSLEEDLQELFNKDSSLIDIKGTEMAELVTTLEDAQEEKAAIEKEIAEVDERRELLVTGLGEKDEKVKKLLKKKRQLENYIDEKMKENMAAKSQLKRELAEIKTKMDDLSKVESLLQPESHNTPWPALMLESIEKKIKAKEKELECPVCLEVASVFFLSPFSKLLPL